MTAMIGLRSLTLELFVWGVLLILAGCGGGGAEHRGDPNAVQVTGSITLDSKPIVGATVYFTPMGPGTTPAMGTTDAAGEYVLVHGTGKAGASAGAYRVYIDYYTKPDGTPIIAPNAEAGEDIEQMRIAGTAKPGLPERYMDSKLSVLKAEVEPGKRNKIDFPLDTKK